MFKIHQHAVKALRKIIILSTAATLETKAGTIFLYKN